MFVLCRSFFSCVEIEEQSHQNFAVHADIEHQLQAYTGNRYSGQFPQASVSDTQGGQHNGQRPHGLEPNAFGIEA